MIWKPDSSQHTVDLSHVHVFFLLTLTRRTESHTFKARFSAARGYVCQKEAGSVIVKSPIAHTERGMHTHSSTYSDSKIINITSIHAHSQAAVDWWTQEYYRLLDEWIGKSRFAGKDQDLMIDIFERQPQRFLLLQSHGTLKSTNMRTRLAMTFVVVVTLREP